MTTTTVTEESSYSMKDDDDETRDAQFPLSFCLFLSTSSLFLKMLLLLSLLSCLFALLFRSE
jgi:hypothetical protein